MFRREQRGGNAQRGAADRGAADGRPGVMSQVLRKARAPAALEAAGSLQASSKPSDPYQLPQHGIVQRCLR